MEIKFLSNNFISYTEAAKLLGVSRQSIYNFIARNELHPVNVNWKYLLLKTEVEQLKLKRQSVE